MGYGCERTPRRYFGARKNGSRKWNGRILKVRLILDVIFCVVITRYANCMQSSQRLQKLEMLAGMHQYAPRDIEKPSAIHSTRKPPIVSPAREQTPHSAPTDPPT
jgi:hypothetical protein